jgi:hypothetical protein
VRREVAPVDLRERLARDEPQPDVEGDLRLLDPARKAPRDLEPGLLEDVGGIDAALRLGSRRSVTIRTRRGRNVSKRGASAVTSPRDEHAIRGPRKRDPP